MVLWLLATGWAGAQTWDPGGRLSTAIGKGTEEKLKINFEQRGRFEWRDGTGFGRETDRSVYLVRTRLGMTVQPTKWLLISGLAQDGRAPLYGTAAPSTLRDPLDLQEGYIELFPKQKGFGAVAGRMMVNYGETRLIGSPQWAALARTFDVARIYHRSDIGQFEFLLISPVKIRIGEFNRPVLGERIWGMYHTLRKLPGESNADIYVLRHDQNRPGGFTAGSRALNTDRLAVNTFGGRFYGPILKSWRYSTEAAVQTGSIGPAAHRAFAWFAAVGRHWTMAERSWDWIAEYKFASGTRNPTDASRNGTFDQMYPANHDKFGHVDLFGWRNLHNVRSQLTWAIDQRTAVHVMYADNWLASKRDAVYNGAGRAIAQSLAGTAGRHVGREGDIFMTWKSQHFLFGAGYGHFFPGEFIRATTPGVGTSLAYVFHTYSF